MTRDHIIGQIRGLLSARGYCVSLPEGHRLLVEKHINMELSELRKGAVAMASSAYVADQHYGGGDERSDTQDAAP